jgi:hypothetical protein
VHARAKRAGCAGCAGCARCAQQTRIEFLPKGILESAALAPYLECWRRDDTSFLCAAPERCARCTYPTMD